MTFARFQDFNIDSDDPGRRPDLLDIRSVDPDLALRLWKQMLRLRAAQESLHGEYHPADEMRCPMHFCIGQEAVPAALSLLVRNEDYLFSHHRSHGFYFAKVDRFDELFAEFYGKEEGSNGGRAGSQDVSFASANFYSGAILAGSAPIAAGAALAFKYKKQPYVAITATGDGATEEGVFWETLNYAAVQQLPMVFICENNFYSTYSPQQKRQAGCNISERVQTFGVKTMALFGNDIVKTYLALEEAIEHARSREGPVFLEFFTYRWNSHVGPEDDDYNNYRPSEEIAYWKTLCPIALAEERLVRAGILTDDLKALERGIVYTEIQKAFDFARNGRYPIEIDWESANSNSCTPLADLLLVEEKALKFDEDQRELIPGPY